MEESPLQSRLTTIERRQSLVLTLLVGLYLLGSLWVLVREVAAVTIWHTGIGAVALTLIALLAVISRRRRAR